MMDNNKFDLLSASYEELCDFLTSAGEAPYRAKQLFSALHRGTSLTEISTLSKALRQKLSEQCFFELPSIETRLESTLDDTKKYLFRMSDGPTAESVFMKYHHGNSVCISTQAGCRQGCAFCASTKRGLVRNLTAGEMIGQIIGIEKDIGERVDGIVLMGTGEPLDNYDNVLKFLRIVTHPNGLNIGQRHISLSTCGLVDRIADLEKEKLQITLSISLHAVDDETRSKIMPVNRKWNVDTLLRAALHYFRATGRRISFEYTLISGVNDTPEDADKIARKFHAVFGSSMPLHINLIPVNSIAETDFQASSEKRIFEFQKRLQREHIVATVRRTLGADIHASCGQLRNRAERKSTENA